MDRASEVGDPALPGCPDPQGLEARVLLTDLRRRLFGRSTVLRVGRYRLRCLLGRGAHGSVFEAEDPVLGRRVALKLIRTDRLGPDPRAARQRLLREARAMAQLSHVNVVQAYAAGTDADRVWVAMELVCGTTLATWTREHPPGSPARFEQARRLLVQAGRGLAAAHAHGLIHRDFKPSNVLIGTDGVVKVADFGLARAWRSTADDPPRRGGPTMDDGRAGAASASHTAGLFGTPRYMSPEQLRGERVEASSDQFNFGVTAWEMVLGTHPFAGDSPGAWLRAIESGAVIDPKTRGVPRWFGRVLRRAMAPEPAERFATMDALLDALEPSRWWPAAGLAGLGATVLAGVALASSISSNPAQAMCTTATARSEWREVWNDARAHAVAQGLRASGLTGIDTATEAVEQTLPRYGQRWTAQYMALCRAHWHEHSLTAEQLDGRMACLRARLDTADALLTHLAVADPQLAARSITAVRSLPEPSTCADPDTRADPPRGRPLRTELATADAERIAGRYATAAERLSSIADEARRAELAVIAGDALELAGSAYAELNDDRRFSALTDAYYLATTQPPLDASRATRRATALATQYAYAGQPQRAQDWLRHAEAALDRGGDPDGRAALAHVRGIVLLKQGELAAAIEAFEQIRHELVDPGSPPTPARDERAWLVAADLLMANLAAGRLDTAHQLASTLYEQTRQELGASHPRLARLSLSLGRIAASRDQRAQALTHIQRAVDISRRVYGRVNPRTALAYLNLGWLYHDAGELTKAEQIYTAALDATGSTRDQWRARILRKLARLRAIQADPTAAAERLHEGLSIAREVWRPTSDERLGIHRELAEAWIELGRLDEAKAALTTVLERQRDAPARTRARTRIDLATIAEHRHATAEAQDHYQHVLAGCPGDERSARWCALAAARRASLKLRSGEAGPPHETFGSTAPSPSPTSAAEARWPAAVAAERLARAQRIEHEGRSATARALVERSLAELDLTLDHASREQRRRLDAWLREPR